MVVENILHMNTGDGETSYANNSGFQKKLLMEAKPFVKETIKSMLSSDAVPDCFKVADLGCSSGPNTFLAVSEIIGTVYGLCEQMKRESPEFQVFLNDLPGNDFNTIFKSTPSFYEDLKKAKGDKLGRVFVVGVPGSFHGRLFPARSLNLVHSSSSLHWLSQVPDGLEENKGCIFISTKSPPQVYPVYLKQFQRDLSLFLGARAEEIVSGGRMVLEFFGRSSGDPTCVDCYYHWQLMANSLVDMAAEGLVKEDDINSFNLPYYTPYIEEVRKIIEEEGSFEISKLQAFETDGDPSGKKDNTDYYRSGQMVAESLRAVLEPMVSAHFGGSIIDDLFTRFGNRMGEHLNMIKKEAKLTVLTIALKKN